MRAARTACTVAGTWMLVRRAVEPVARRAPREDARLDEASARSPRGRTGCPRCARSGAAFSGASARIVAEEGLKQRVRARRGERVQPQLGVVGPAAPAVLVLGPVAHEDEDPRGGQALDAGRRGTPAVSESSQCRFSKTRSSGCAWLSRSRRRLTASSVRWRRWGGSRTAATPRPRRAGRAARGRRAASGRRARSSVRSLPVTFSRMWSAVVALVDLEVRAQEDRSRAGRRGPAVGHANRPRGRASRGPGGSA